MKVCKKCLLSKDESEFRLIKSKYCEVCKKEKQKNYYQDNKEKIKEYYQKNKDSKKEYQKFYQDNNKEKIKQKSKEIYKKKKALKPIKEKKVKEPKIPKVLTEEQKLKKKLYWKEYRQIHKERYRKNKRIYKKLKKENDPVYKLKEACRKTIYMSIKRKGFSKKTKTYQILGCSYEEFKTHIESQFEPWMNWDNYGLCNNEFNYGWDIDHIIPCASATTEEELLKLNHYTNLRPLCSHINRNIKRDRLNF
jgi:hypothetical protein